jgi:hypothetical protein
MTAEYRGPEACKMYTFELGKQLRKIEPFVGAIYIVAGLVTAFAGFYLLFHLFGALVFLLT